MIDNVIDAFFLDHKLELAIFFLVCGIAIGRMGMHKAELRSYQMGLDTGTKLGWERRDKFDQK